MQSGVKEMQPRSDQLGDRLEGATSDWHSTQGDVAVPGARPPSDDAAEHPSIKPT
jgi:hypothetical protein